MNFFKLVLFCTLWAKLISAINPEDLGEKFTPCGLYGFRCLDKKRAQICDEKYRDCGCSPAPRIFECSEGLVCDESKKEFCAPTELTHSNCSTSKKHDSKRSSNRNRVLRVRKKSQNNFFDDEMDQVTMITTSAKDDDFDDEEGTKKPENDPWNGTPPISCRSHGFYPGLLL